MRNTKNPELHFPTYEAAAAWFESHDMTEYEDDLVPVDMQFDLRQQHNWVELDGEIAADLRKLAHHQHISTRTLVNTLLKAQLARVG